MTALQTPPSMLSRIQGSKLDSSDSSKLDLLPKEPPKMVAPTAIARKGSYKAIELVRFAKGDGTVVTAVDGYFTPLDKEESDMLEYYSTKYNLVKKV